MISPAQDSLYWREWGAVSRFCKANKMPLPDRHALHVKALGADKSHKTFSNADLDKVLAAFRAISRPDDLNAQLRQANQPRIRLYYAIRKLADKEYIQALLESARFKSKSLDNLSNEELLNFRNTLAARMSGARRKKKVVKAEQPDDDGTALVPAGFPENETEPF